MRKQSAFILLISLSTLTTSMYAILEIPAIWGISLTAMNTAATCCLCFSRCQDKSERRENVRQTQAIKEQMKRIDRAHERLYTAALNCGFTKSKNTAYHSKATNTDLVLITPLQASMKPRRSLEEKTPPTECQ